MLAGATSSNRAWRVSRILRNPRSIALRFVARSSGLNQLTPKCSWTPLAEIKTFRGLSASSGEGLLVS